VTVTRELVVDSLRVEVFDDVGALAASAARDAAATIAEAVSRRGTANVMLATGNSQLAFLDAVAASDDVDWRRVVGFHMDEYLGMGPDHAASFRRYMRERVVGKVHPGEFHELGGDAPDPAQECERYAALLRAHPLDLCCLGIGENGHLAFNDPGVADFDDPLDVKIVELDATCRGQQVGEGHFASLDDVPRRALTVTVPALLRAGHVLAIVPEARKAEPVRRTLRDEITTACPATALRRHPHATLYLDSASASRLGP
jgi:glucosamine-6-phosphate deaminase